MLMTVLLLQFQTWVMLQDKIDVVQGMSEAKLEGTWLHVSAGLVTGFRQQSTAC